MKLTPEEMAAVHGVPVEDVLTPVVKFLTRLRPGELPSVADLPDGTTKGDLAAALVHCPHDLALPQDWLCDVADKLSVAMDYGQLASSVVWAYPDDSLMGLPAPLTVEAAFQLRRQGIEYYAELRTGD